jgi:zinc/manganese transport system permease protein
MSFDAAAFSIVWPALLAGLLVTATHVPMGIQVLKRGIVFIDLAVAQIAGLGVIVADRLGFEPQGFAVQIAALGAALGGALLLNWTDRRWPEVQEAVIGVSFIVAANAAILLLATNPHGAENLKDLLVGQILWADPTRLGLVALLYAAILGLWFGLGERVGRIGFYLLFAFAVTASVQLVGVYLVFTTLIVPALATRRLERRRLAVAYGLGAAGYALGLALSLASDLPPGPLIVCTMTALGVALFLGAGLRRRVFSRQARHRQLIPGTISTRGKAVH